MQADKINLDRSLFNTYITLYRIFFMTNNNITAIYVCNYADSQGLPIKYDNNFYEPYPVSQGNTSEGIIDSNGSSITLSNIGGKFRPILPNSTELIKGEVEVIELLFDVLEPDSDDKLKFLVSNKMPTVFRHRRYHISKVSAYNSLKVEFTLKSYKDTNLMIPTKDISSLCIYEFKDINCRYIGNEKACNKSYQRCKELNNTINFGGFIGRDKF